MPPNIPSWLQFAATIATSISGVGVIIALIQVIISNKQLKAQLETTKGQLDLSEKQFNLDNRGYLIFQCQTVPHGPTFHKGAIMKPGMKYTGIWLVGNLENAGNSPIMVDVTQLEIYYGDIEQFKDKKLQEVTKVVIVPKQVLQLNLGYFPFDKGNLLSPAQAQNLNISCKILLKYRDDLNPKHVRTIDRKMHVLFDDYQVTGLFNEIGDSEISG